MICLFELTVDNIYILWAVMEEAICQWAAYPFMKKNEHSGNLHALIRQSVGIMFAITLNQAMRLHLPEIVTELINGVLWQPIRSADVFMEKVARPSIQTGAGIHNCFHQTDHAFIMNLNAGDTCIDVCNGQSHPLK